MNMNLSKVQETVEDRGVWYAAVHVVAKIGDDLGTEQQKTYAELVDLRLNMPISLLRFIE